MEQVALSLLLWLLLLLFISQAELLLFHLVKIKQASEIGLLFWLCLSWLECAKSIHLSNRLCLDWHWLSLTHIHATEHVRGHLLGLRLCRGKQSKLIGLVECLRLVWTQRLCKSLWLHWIVLWHCLLLTKLRVKVELRLLLELCLLLEHWVQLWLLLHHWVLLTWLHHWVCRVHEIKRRLLLCAHLRETGLLWLLLGYAS